jgi:hypothetical protein
MQLALWTAVTLQLLPLLAFVHAAVTTCGHVQGMLQLASLLCQGHLWLVVCCVCVLEQIIMFECVCMVYSYLLQTHSMVSTLPAVFVANVVFT